MNNDEPPDPPMTPFPDSARWFESGPEPIIADPAIATLMVRVGMAYNALVAQMHAAADAKRRPQPAQQCDVVCSLVASAAFTTEAIRLAKEGMATLREFARKLVATDDARRAHVETLLQRVGQLCAGKHPADQFLKRARQNIGFHWDKEHIEPWVRDFGKNKAIVWLELDDESESVHRLAHEVLANVMVADDPSVTSPAEAHRAVIEALKAVDDAMDIIIEFFTVAMFGYLLSRKIIRKTKTAKSQEE